MIVDEQRGLIRCERGQAVVEYAMIAGILTLVFMACAAFLEDAISTYHDHVVSVVCLPFP